jgi:transposase
MSDRFDHTLEHTLECKPDEADDPVVGIRRIELITGGGRRRRWSTDEKARILVESLKPGANISEVARRNGLSPQQLFGWRREVRCDPAAGRSGAPSKNVREPDHAAPTPNPQPSPRPRRGRPKHDRGGAPGVDEAPTHFAAVVIAAPAASPPPSPPAGGSPPDRFQPGAIEITIGDAVVRISGQVDMALLAAVLRAIRRAS